jgi:hypothetical protein
MWRFKRGIARAALRRADAARADLNAALGGESRDWVRGRTHLALGKLETDRAAARRHYEQAIVFCRRGGDTPCADETEDLID